MAWCRTGVKQLPESMMTQFNNPIHICVNRFQWNIYILAPVGIKWITLTLDHTLVYIWLCLLFPSDNISLHPTLKSRSPHSNGQYISWRERCYQIPALFLTLNRLRPTQNCHNLQTTFPNAFCVMKMYACRLRFHWSLFLRAQLKYSCIGSDNGLAPSRCQAINWTNDG